MEPRPNLHESLMNDRGPYTVQMHQQDQGNGVISVREEFGDSAIAPRAVEEAGLRSSK